MKLTEAERGKQLAEVLRLSMTEGHSERAIAKRLGIARQTVRRLLGKAPSKVVAQRPQVSILDPYLAVIRKLVEEAPTIRAPAVLERLRPLGYEGGVSILRDRLVTLRPHPQREAFLTLDFAPGEAVQIDWADFGFALPGCPRRVSGFVMALCHSRYLYLEFTLSQSLPSLLRCMERGLRFYGGVTSADIFDNMKTVVLSHTPTATVFNPQFLEYARARGFAIRACNVRRGNEKGRVERPIGFIRDRFWLGRRFVDLRDLNLQSSVWRDEVANHRVHEVTGKVPALVFEHEEKAALRPLPQTPFETDDKQSSMVTKSFRVRFDRNSYSVPWKLCGQSVLVRADDASVAIFLGPKQVASHARCWDAGKDLKLDSHEQGLLEQKPGADKGRLPPALVGLGQLGERYFKVFSANGRSIAKETIRITLLTELFDDGPTASAIEEVMATGHVGAEYVEHVLRHKRGLTPSPPPLRLGDPILDAISLREPDLSVYDRLPQKTLDPEAK
jgi:transposase